MGTFAATFLLLLSLYPLYISVPPHALHSTSTGHTSLFLTAIAFVFLMYLKVVFAQIPAHRICFRWIYKSRDGNRLLKFRLQLVASSE